MRSPRLAIAGVLALFFLIRRASPVVSTAIRRPRSLEDVVAFDGPLTRRDGGHGHGNHHSAPLAELNETEVTLWHQPTPPSYYTFDFEGEGDPTARRHAGLMMIHILFMSLAFFGALPIGIVLRSVRHPAHGASMIAFYGFSALGVFSSIVYSKMTPNMYEGSVHGKHGYFVLLLAVCLSTIDIMAGLSRFVSFLKSDDRSMTKFCRYVILNQRIDDPLPHGPEYSGLIVDDPDQYEFSKLGRHSDEVTDQETEQWANEVHNHHRKSSVVSDRTLFRQGTDSHSSDTLNDTSRKGRKTPQEWLSFAGRTIFSIVERSLVLTGFGMILTGIVVYTGGCRQNWVNGCLAHLIKGGIFWSYGLLTFSRFLGSYSELGWAWNRAPKESRYSAEFVESFIIFLYGITNTWMERFGAHRGDPFTTKQVQHISIAVMFWFAGLIGMGIESKRVRKWLAASTISRPTDLPQDAVTEPPSYLASFNPFPALVIGVTGAAMAAHHQTYVFQVDIHKLWGDLLVGFSVLRCLTYFFVWLAPPTSILPSRPPTEALASFFLACGGLVFMFSVEEVTIAAMRRGRDDVMMFLNVAVATTCFAFCWMFSLVALKGFLKSRSNPGMTYRSSGATA